MEAPDGWSADTYLPTLAAQERPGACRARDPAGVTAWQSAFRPRLQAMLGLPRIAARGACALEPRLLGESEEGDHRLQEWSIQTEPGFRLPLLLLLPPGEGPHPLVITPHGHGRAGKRTYAGLWATQDERREIEEGQRDVALQAVRAGYVAAAPDMRGFASLRRREELQRDATSSCRALALYALLLGRTLLGERVWDMSRLIDWAAGLPAVDATRIAITGNSGGGTVSLFAAACDPRIGVAVPSCYFCTFLASIGSVHHCECNYVPGLLAEAEMADVAGLIAPRPLLAVAGRDDPLFPLPGVREAYADLQRIYAAAGAPERCALHVGEGGHRYYSAAVWPFVARWL